MKKSGFKKMVNDKEMNQKYINRITENFFFWYCVFKIYI